MSFKAQYQDLDLLLHYSTFAPKSPFPESVDIPHSPCPTDSSLDVLASLKMDNIYSTSSLYVLLLFFLRVHAEFCTTFHTNYCLESPATQTSVDIQMQSHSTAADELACYTSHGLECHKEGPVPWKKNVVWGENNQMETGQVMILSSSITLTTRNTKYSRNMSKPSILLIFHLQTAMEMMTKRSMRKSRTMAQNRPLLLTVTGEKSFIMEKSSQGNGRLETGNKHTFIWMRIVVLMIKDATIMKFGWQLIFFGD